MTVNRMSRVIALLVGACLSAGALASCSGPAESKLVPLPQKNIDLWVLPLDDYRPMSSELMAYYEALVTKACVVGAGFHYPLAEVADLTRLPLPTENSARVRLFSPTIAAEWGYHMAQYDDELRRAGRAVEEGTYTAADDAQFEKCSGERPETLPEHDLIAINKAQMHAGEVWAEAIVAGPVVEAGAAWKVCMAPLGISDLPDMPTDMLPPSLASFMASETPSAEEIRIAVADAECRDSSGFSEVLYTTEWDLQAAVLQEQADSFVQTKAINDAYEAGLMETVRNLEMP